MSHQKVSSGLEQPMKFAYHSASDFSVEIYHHISAKNHVQRFLQWKGRGREIELPKNHQLADLIIY